MIITPVKEIALYLFGFPIYWYGIVLAVAIYVGMRVANSLYNEYYEYVRRDVIYEYTPVIVFWGLIFARLYYCVLNLSYYLSKPLEILNLRQGGLSIHGAILGGLLAILYVSFRTKSRILRLLSTISCGTLLAQSIGRWGNYFNSEAYGYPTDQTWGLFIPPAKRLAQYAQYNYFHPTFLYESILDFIGFVVLYIFFKKQFNKNDGRTFFLYLMIYSAIRFVIEPMRVDCAFKILGIPIASIVSVIAFGIGFYFFKKNKTINF